ncbi:cation transporter [Acidaminococcus fermentans]|uniref:cation transporter n=1 Tax=Acidaminococcus fermentans TaxID=905 RepID=UPI002E76990F|nr:cation transporter [Acidaminococcus fermentans]MEE1598363.1 cation transporter [Acidaminococcus fermentans]MEE4122625.1 cation transporter [Acidaminococcus fermentans]
MKKSYKVEVDCANCAAKMEETVKATPGVQDAVLNFMLLKLKVTFAEGADPAEVMGRCQAAVAKLDDDCKIYC